MKHNAISRLRSADVTFIERERVGEYKNGNVEPSEMKRIIGRETWVGQKRWKTLVVEKEARNLLLGPYSSV